MGVISVDTRSRQPIYEQLCESIRRSILSGQIPPGSQLPSVRSLAGELAINPNTIQKAYAELERKGVISSLPGRGSFVPDSIDGICTSERKQLLERLEKALVEARSAGVSRASILELLDKHFQEDNTNERQEK